MHRILLITLLTCLFVLTPGQPARAQREGGGQISIFSPRPGEAVQGLVQIIGTVDVEGFDSYELAFSFSDDSTQTWFQIAQGDTPVIQSVLAEWDTTVLTDSTFNLLLRVRYQGGSATDVVLEGIRVRNYSPIETATAAPENAAGSQENTPTPVTQPPTDTPIPPTPTELPENPAAVDAQQLSQAAIRGGITGMVLILAVLLYSRNKRRSNRL